MFAMRKDVFTRRQLLILITVIATGAIAGYLGPIVLLNLLLGGSLF